MLQTWESMTDAEQQILASFLLGIVLWFVQWVWTKLPIPGPQPNWETWEKRLWSVVLALLPGIGVALKTGNWQSSLLTAAVVWAGSQTAYSATRKGTPTGSPVVEVSKSPANYK